MATPSGDNTCHHVNKAPRLTDYSGESSEMRPLAPCEASASCDPTAPLMADLMSGPNAPLTKGFIMAGWRTMPIDRLFGPHHDLSDTNVQLAVHEALRDAAFIAAALDCSTKSRCRQIPSKIPGKNLPPPLRSDEYPMGLPGLQGSDKERVATDNTAAEFILAELRLHADRGGASIRENPQNSLHWSTPTEVNMMSSGSWWDQLY